MSSQANAAARVGTTLAGKYALRRLLGAGGMGAVYEAENLRTERRVAVKVLLTEQVDRDLGRRFLREARAASRLQHPHIVQVFDMDEDPSDGAPFIVQELLVGQDLRAALDQRGAFPAREAVAVAVPLLRALAAAHTAGVVHRDLKPENVFLAAQPVDDGAATVVPKLIDFGVAKLYDPTAADARREPSDGPAASTAQRTETGRLLGTPRYMSPEQARGEVDVDARTDVWAIGVVLYEMLTGRAPFSGANYAAVLTALLMQPAPALAEQGFDAELSLLVARALERDRARRWRSAEAFADALAEWLEHAPAGDAAWVGPREHAPARDAAAGPAAPTPAPRPAAPSPVPPHAARRRRVIGAVVGAVAALAGLLAIVRVPPTSRALASPRAVLPARAALDARIAPPAALSVAPEPPLPAPRVAPPADAVDPPAQPAHVRGAPREPARGARAGGRPRARPLPPAPARRPAVVNDAPVLPL